MTKTEIIAELRRSAAEDARPVANLLHAAYMLAIDFTGDFEHPMHMRHDDCRTFFLLVACALDTE